MKTHAMISVHAGATGTTQMFDSPAFSAHGLKRLFKGLVLAAVVMFARCDVMAMSVDPVNLGLASGFAALAGSGITITGATTVNGNVGVYPTTTITGLENLTLNGVNHGGDSVAQSAQSALLSAYNDADGRAYNLIYAGGFDLVGQTLNSGVYRSDSSLALSGTLTLDAQGDPNAVFIIQTGTTLITASGSHVVLINGAQAANVIWQIGSSATLASDSYFVGNILAHDSITLNTGATVDGRVLALIGAVTFDGNVVTVPEPSMLQLFGIGIVSLAALTRKRGPRTPTSRENEKG
jgi:hypothetical protein